ncbi:MAG: hypothetical protein KBT11_11385 [Treponema sp.]|nr:hypothetical protein [Candidatus Treponema equifaecale]
MKNKIWNKLFSIALSFFLFAACSNDDSSAYLFLPQNTGSNSVPPSQNTTSTFDFSKGKTFELKSTDSKIIAEGVYGKNIYMVRLNMGDSNIPAENLTYVKNSDASVVQHTPENPEPLKNLRYNHRMPRTENLNFNESNLRSTASDFDPQKFRLNPDGIQIAVNVGDEREVKLMDSNPSFTPPSGSYIFKALVVSDHCIFWVPKEDDSINSNNLTSEMITEEMARIFVDAFEASFPKTEKMYGSRSDKIELENKAGTKVFDDIKYYTQYAEKTNLFVYLFDHSLGGTLPSTLGAVGYFAPDDYVYTIDDTSENLDFSNLNTGRNIGNNLYINSLNLCDLTDKDKSEGNKISSDSKGTLIHEYMHSLQYARKVIDAKGPYDDKTGYTEILGSLAEDVFADTLGISPSISNINTRFDFFMKGYWNWGVFENPYGDKDTIQRYSYENYAALGAFLARNKGGTVFVGNLVRNDKVGWDSILKAIYDSNNQENVTALEVMKQFAESLLCQNSQYNTNIAFEDKTNNMKLYPINMFNLNDCLPKAGSSEKIKYYPDSSMWWTKRPYIFSANGANEADRKHLMKKGGMHLCLIKENCQNNTYTIDFTLPDNDGEIVLIMADDYIPIEQ